MILEIDEERRQLLADLVASRIGELHPTIRRCHGYSAQRVSSTTCSCCRRFSSNSRTRRHIRSGNQHPGRPCAFQGSCANGYPVGAGRVFVSQPPHNPRRTQVHFLTGHLPVASVPFWSCQNTNETKYCTARNGTISTVQSVERVRLNAR